MAERWLFFVGYTALGPGNAFCPACGGPVERTRAPLAGFVFAGGGLRRCCRGCLDTYAPWLSDLLDDDAAARATGWRGRSGLTPVAEYATPTEAAEVRVEVLPPGAIELEQGLGR
jgi:hypothetical protein